MVLEKLVRLEFDEGQKSLVIVDTGEKAINPIQLTGIKILIYSYPDSTDRISMLEWHEKNAPNNANAYLGIKTVSGGYTPASPLYHPVVYFHIDDEQAERIPKRDIKKKTNIFDPERVDP